MNKNRRKQLEKIVEALEALRDDLEMLKDEEQDCFDNLPESLQESEKGEIMQEYADDLEAAYDDLDNVICSIQDIIDR